MNASEEYFQPVSKNTKPKVRNPSTVSKKGNVENPTAPVEMTFTPSKSGGSSPGSSSFASRPSAKFSYGDFRNTPRHSILDMKADVMCAMTVNTRIIRIFLSKNTENYVPLGDRLRLQVLPSAEHLHRCQKHHFGAFIADQKILVVWDDEPQNIFNRAEKIENSLIHMIWEGSNHVYDEKKTSIQVSTTELSNVKIIPSQLEEALTAVDRPTVLITPITVGLTLALLMTALGLGWRKLAQQIAIDGNYTHLALLVVTPFYSGKGPLRLDRNLTLLPHVTIQMPVYKERLTAVIKPTIMSLKAAISTYELQGGTANIFVNDDGLQLLSQDEAQQRRDFYEEHNIGWVARPKHNPKPEGDDNAFVRRGKFKKASNMNYALMISNKVEDKLLLLERFQGWTQDHEYAAYERCLAEALHEEDGRAWADGNIRVGDYILLINSDTRVPADCLLDAGSEMEKSPEIGILQYSSGVMQVTNNFFENGVTFFTNLIYTAIRYGVANGDVVSYEDEDGYDKFWSESHVSEDFDMSLRLQISGYIIRLAAYTGDGFKEGVSLTVYDEIARWEKYAFGCNELLFHPFRLWVTRGPFTPLFRKLLTSNIPLTSKITIMSYIGTYYAIGAAWILTLFNYFLIGWFNGNLDHYLLDSFRVYFSLILVFSGLGNVALAVLRYRLSEKILLGALWENFKWVPLLSVFLGGISLHLSQALLSHFFEIEMSWEATAKEAENTSFFEEVPRLLKRFKFTFIFSIACSALMIAGKFAFPWNWEIGTFQAIYPLAAIVVSHFVVPIALNPEFDDVYVLEISNRFLDPFTTHKRPLNSEWV
ncbi:hypothetical protein LHYA1_G002821 [Lachnellula hyalina]|uniref:Glycosyltransferase 2-like domain-containing protein n=1 Tax=Lachnellula hyalina TaxID=1316788 RepID=A0A8H8U1K0_9HELO|nr:uncharacterized protein LHYA1_G002821 [Lachnellula hyalina]TVY28420.1 hypothetical protein LHYA1_G002821 [Lachnellula hyalina]